MHTTYNLNRAMLFERTYTHKTHAYSDQIEFYSILSMSVSLLFTKIISYRAFHICVLTSLAIYLEWNSLEFWEIYASFAFIFMYRVSSLSLSLFSLHPHSIWKYKITAHELDQYEEVKTSGVHWVLSDLNWHKLGGFLLTDLMGTDSGWLTRIANNIVVWMAMKQI